MPKFKLSESEILEILDKLHPNAYDKLQNSLEAKILKVLSEEKWLDIWQSGECNIELSITFNEIKELENA